MILFGLISTMALLQTLAAQTAEVQYVQFGVTVSMGCNLTFSYETAWLRKNPLGPPTIAVVASLIKGQTVYGPRVDSRYTVEYVDRYHTLTITDVNENDLGMYYCVVFFSTELLIGSGIVLQGPLWFGFYHWYCIVVGLGLLSMVICVCMIHYKTKEERVQTYNPE